MKDLNKDILNIQDSYSSDKDECSFTTVSNNTLEEDNSIIFQVEDITIEVHSPVKITSDEDNKKQLAKYFYKLIEMSEDV